MKKRKKENCVWPFFLILEFVGNEPLLVKTIIFV